MQALQEEKKFWNSTQTTMAQGYKNLPQAKAKLLSKKRDTMQVTRFLCNRKKRIRKQLIGLSN